MQFKKAIALLLSFILLAGSSVPIAAATITTPPQKELRVQYTQIDSMVRSQNQTIRANEKTLDSLNSNDVIKKKQDELSHSTNSLKTVSDQLKNAYHAVSALPATPEQQGIATSLQGSIASIESIGSLLKAQSDQLSISDDVIDQTELQMKEAADQIVWAAQKLFITYHYLDTERLLLQKQKSMMESTLKLAQLKTDLGLMTQTELLDAQQQKNTVSDSLTELRNQLQTVKSNFRVLLGYSDDYTVSLALLPKANVDFMKNRNYEDDMQTALESNWTLKQKKLEKEITKDNQNSNLESTEDDYRAASLQHSLAKNTFSVSFQQVYREVEEKQQRLTSAQAAYDAKKKALEVMQWKLELGVASVLELQTAQLDADRAEIALEQANIHLFSAQEKYRWALWGLLSSSEQS